MKKQEFKLVENSFVVIKNVDKALDLLRVAYVQHVLLNLDAITRRCQELVSEHCSTLADWKAYSLGEKDCSIYGDDRDPLAVPGMSVPNSRYANLIYNSMNRILQVREVVEDRKDGTQKARFMPWDYRLLYMDTATMEIVPADEKLIEGYKEFHRGVKVKIKNPQGILYDYNSSYGVKDSFYPVRKELERVIKEDLFDRLVKHSLTVGIVEPSEKRILILNDSPIHLHAVYVRPECLEII